MECHKSQNAGRCNCTYEPCPRKGKCCECIAYHLDMQELQEGGLGLLLIRSLMDEVTQQTGRKGNTILRMTKRASLPQRS